MKHLMIALTGLAIIAGGGTAAVAQGPGQCAKGMKWDAKDGKCVPAKPAPKGKGSGSGSG